jgi:glycosyltransferase involved in cell wall biosynthesis
LAFVTDAPHFGGAERYIVAMARAAARRGIQPHILWLPTVGSRTDVFEGSVASGIHVTHVPINRTQTLAALIRAFRVAIARLCPDALVINATGRPRFWTLPLVARSYNIPCVWVHQMVEGRDHRRLRPNRLGGRFEGLQFWRVPQTVRHRLAACGAGAVIVLNAEDREQIIRWQRVPRERTRVVPHGVDLDRFEFDEAGRHRFRHQWMPGNRSLVTAPIVGTAGRLVSGKGIELLIEAAALLKKRAVDCRLVIAGDGQDRSKMEGLAAGFDVLDRVVFAGFVEDMPAFYSALDVFALCSDTESFGLVLAEAMACGRIVVGTPTAGTRRQIDHQRTGWLLQSFSSVELADALAAIVRDHKRYSAMGAAARTAVARQFSIDLTLERTLRALRCQAGSGSRLLWPGMNAPFYAAMTAEDLS